MRKLIFRVLLVVGVFLSAGYLGAEEQSFPFMGEVNANNINVRCDATVTSKIICTVNERDIIEVTVEVFGWYKIRLPKSALCYIKAKYVKIITQAAGEGTPETQNITDNNFGIVNADSVNIRLEPNESSCILGRVNKNKAVNIMNKEGDWYKITAPNTTGGWINKKFVKPIPNGLEKLSVATEPAQLPAIQEPPGAQKEIIAPQQTAKDTITVVGIVEPYGKIIGRKGTHKIIAQDKHIYILKGDKKLLNSCSYRKAVIKGKLQEILSQEYPLILVENVEVLE